MLLFPAVVISRINHLVGEKAKDLWSPIRNLVKVFQIKCTDCFFMINDLKARFSKSQHRTHLFPINFNIQPLLRTQENFSVHTLHIHTFNS